MLAKRLIPLLIVSLSTLAPAQVLRSVTSVPVDVPATQAKVPLSVEVYLDRVVYTDRDQDGQGLVVINPPALLYEGKLAEHRVRVELRPAEGAAQEPALEASVSDSDHFAVDLDMPKLALGAYQLVATLLDPQGQVLATGQASFSKRKDDTPLPTLPVDVPLVLTQDHALVNFTNVPITTGIPLPDGLLQDPRQVTLLEDGREIPCQVTVRSRWSRRGAIKWLGLDFPARYENGVARKYVLRLGAPAKAKPARPVEIIQTPSAFILSNGLLEVTVSRKRFRLFESVLLDRNRDGECTEDETIVQAKPQDGPYWINAEGKGFYAALDPNPQVNVEEAGPLRTTLRADGWLTAEDGQQAGRYTTRITMQAERAQVGVNQTYVITWNTMDRAMRIHDMGVATSPVDLQKAYMLGGLQRELPQAGTLYALYDRWDRMTIAESESGKVITSFNSDSLRYNVTNWINSRLPLAFGGMGPRGYITVAQRYLAEKFPKEISVGRDQLTWHAWPAHGSNHLQGGTAIENYSKLYWLHQGELLDFQIPDEYFTAAEEWRKLYPDTKVTLLMYKNHDYYASGTAITGELLYGFAPEAGGDTGRIWNQAAPLIYAFESHPQAIADPQWGARTDLLEFAPPVTPEYPEIERGVADLYDRTMATIDDFQLYGQFLWPNGTTYPGDSYSALHRNRLNAHHGAELTGWMLYLRSGEAKYWHYASALSRYLLDHASATFDPSDPKTSPRPAWGVWPGSVYHCQGMVPWSKREPELVGHMSPQWHACLLYYMTGDTQALDFAKLTVTSVLKAFRTEQDYRVREPYKGELNRNPACGWGMMTHLYAELLDPRLLRPIGDLGKQIFNGGPLLLHGGAPPDGQSGRWWWHTYTQRWRDPAAIKAITEVSPFGGQSFAGYNTYRALVTGDPTPVYALWLETQGLAPLRQWGMGHPAKYSAFSPTADNYQFLLPMVTAMKHWGLPEVPQLLPMGYAPGAYTVLHQDTDAAFNLCFWGPVYEGPEDRAKYPPVTYVLTDPSGHKVLEGEIDRKALGFTPQHGIHVPVPADGQTGDYVLRLTGGGPVSLVAPVSDLAKEVYVVPAGNNLTATHLYWRSAPGETQRELRPHNLMMGENYSMLLRLEHLDGSLVQAASTPQTITLKVQPDTMYFMSTCVAGQTGYAWRWKGVMVPGLLVSPGPDMVLATEPSRWFAPTTSSAGK